MAKKAQWQASEVASLSVCLQKWGVRCDSFLLEGWGNVTIIKDRAVLRDALREMAQLLRAQLLRTPQLEVRQGKAQILRALVTSYLSQSQRLWTEG